MSPEKGIERSISDLRGAEARPTQCSGLDPSRCEELELPLGGAVS
jgi:hypothetical protein